MTMACPPPSGSGTQRDVVAARLQSFDRRCRHAALDLGGLALIEHARRVDRGLHVHAVVDHVGDDVRVAHRLVVRAHHAERHRAAPVAHRERRNDRMHRPLARRDRVRVVRLDHEARAAIVQHDAGLLGADAGAEARCRAS